MRYQNLTFFYRAALNAGRSSHEKAVSLSVCQTFVEKTKETCAHILIPHERPLVLWQEEWLVGGPLLPEIMGQADPVGAKMPIFSRYSLVALQP